MADAIRQFDAARFMPEMPRPFRWRRRALAEVMHQRGEAHRQCPSNARSHVDHRHRVRAGVGFLMMLRRLRHVPQAVQFGQDARQRAAVSVSLA
mgnify:CR=1 FL=1